MENKGGFIKEYAFEKFPRGTLPTIVNRRQFFQGIIHDLSKLRSDQSISTSFRLADLGAMPDDQLAQVVPVFSKDCGVQVNSDGYIWAKTPDDNEPTRLFPENIPASIVINLFDGVNSLGVVSELLARKTSWEKAYAFSYSRGVFLSLVMAKIIIPKAINTKSVEKIAESIHTVQKT